MNNFIKRTLSGIVYVAFVVLTTAFYPQYFGALFLLITIMAIKEFHVLMASSRPQTILSMLAGGLLFATSSIACVGLPEQMAMLPIGIVAYALVLIIALVSELFLKAENPILNWGNTLGAQVMIAVPFALMNYILKESNFLLLALFITIWVNDSGAYCVGSLLAKRKGGNHKMFPRVSPAKSWEGLIGGILFALVAGYIFYLVGWIPNLGESLLYTFLIAVAGTLGDLMESLMKRTIGVKDSGRFLPGHGGVLDRFDSLLLATPVVAVVLFFLSLAL